MSQAENHHVNLFLKQRIPVLAALFRQHPVSRVYAFGSVCTDKFTEDSDIDLIVSFSAEIAPLDYGDAYWSLDENLPRILNRKVDLLTEKMLTNPYFIQEVNRTKTLIYEYSN